MTGARALAAGGALAASLPGFAPRAVQQQLAQAVESAIADGVTLVAEAGTGVGKTFAYLTPLLQCGRRAVVSTATRHLQDQLFHRDLPLLRRALGYGEPVALLKGRANYLCHYRFEQTRLDRARLAPAQLAQLEAVEAWVPHTADGDIAGLAELAEDAEIWPRVTSTVENCLGGECPHLASCHVLEARRAAQSARLVVVNHHLLFADMALKEEGFGEVLPQAEVFVLDEAHQLPEIASNFFGRQLSSRQVLGLAQDTRAAQLREAADAAHLRELAAALEGATRELRLGLGAERRRAPWFEAPASAAAPLDRLRGALAALGAELEIAAPRGKGLEHCHRRAGLLLGELALFDPELPPHDEAGEAPLPASVRSFETHAQGFVLRSTPVDVAPLFRSFVGRVGGSWVFTSATLAVGGRFEHFCQRLGLEAPRELLLDSPFDYARNALLYLPENMPLPGGDTHSDAVAALAARVVAVSRGRAFILLTSYRALRRVAQALRPQLAYPTLVQGDAPKAELLARFRAAGDAVLIGTSSFWEGVDVRGEALSCVIIDKLPFAAVGDPVLQARLEALRRAGQEPFRDYQLPQAVITLKQGMGRLIRDAGDRGVLVLCDPRVRARGYGRVFIDSLPPMPVTADFAAVADFFAA